MSDATQSPLMVGGEMLLYGYVGESWYRRCFTEDQVAEALAAHGPNDIVVRVNSGGGDAFAGMAIYSLFRAHSARGGKVAIVIDGVAASAASVLAMGADTLSMRLGATMMIHDASTVSFGTARDLERDAKALDTISAQSAAVYAARSGKSRDAMRDYMLAETWFGAEDAKTEGLIDVVETEASSPPAPFEYTAYRRAPQALMAHNVIRPAAASATAPAAAAAPRQEARMSAHNPAPAVDPAPSPASPKEAAITAANTPANPSGDAPKAWLPGFYAAAEKSGLGLAQINAIVTAASDLPAAQAGLIDAMAAARPAPQVAPRTEVTADARDRFAAGAEKALLARAGLDGGERNEFASMSLREMARASLEASGARMSFASPLDMVRRALMAAPGHHGTSDFPLILGNVARKSLLKGYQEVSETFESWTSAGTLPDFKASTRLDIGLFPALGRVEEGAEYSYATIGERGVTLSLAKYGRLYAITWEAIVNDDMDVLSRVPKRMGAAAKRTIGNLAYAVLTGNPTMSDGKALFHADHANLATGAGSALSETSLQAARLAMRKQADPGGGATAINISAKYLLVPAALESVARELMTSSTKLGQANPAIKNPVAGMAEVVVDPRLDAASTTAWYLAGDPNVYDTIEVSYLDGHREPEMFEEQGFEVDGVRHKVRQVAGVNPLDWRALYKSAGA